MRELHVDTLFEAGLVRPLSKPHLLLSIDLAHPPLEDSDRIVQVRPVELVVCVYFWGFAYRWGSDHVCVYC